MSDRQGRDDHHSDAPEAPPTAQLLRLADFDRTQPARIVMEMRDYWQGLRKGRAVPARSDIEPRGIHRALDYAFILERIAPGAARFRLAGRHLIDLMGMEVRGMPVCAFLSPSSRGRFSDVLESVFKAPQIAELRLLGRAEYARPQLDARMLLLPLRSDLGDVTRALGCLVSEGDPGVAPRRFDLAEELILPIIEGGETLAPSPSAQQGFGEDGAPFTRTDRILARGRSRTERPPSPSSAEAPPPAAQTAGKPGPKPVTAGAEAGRENPTPPRSPESPEARRAMFKIISAES